MRSNNVFSEVPFDSLTQLWSKSPFLDLNWLFGVEIEELRKQIEKSEVAVPPGMGFEGFRANNRSAMSMLLSITGKAADWSRAEDILLSSEYLMAMDRDAFTSEALVQHYRHMHQFVTSCLSKWHEELEVSWLASHPILCPAIKWCAHEKTTETVINSVLDSLEETIEAVASEIDRQHFENQLFDYQNLLIYCYFLVSREFKTGISASVVSRHLLVFRRVSSSDWAEVSPKAKMQYASLVLHLILQFYPADSEIKPTYGFSLKTLADFRAVMSDAAGTSVDPPFTVHQWVFRWFKDKLDAEVFSTRQGMADWAGLSLLSDGEQGLVVELSRRFAGYRLPVTVHHIARFLTQFGTTARIRGALRLLLHAKFYPLWELADVMERLLARKLVNNSKGRLVVAPLGDQSGSTAIIKYLASHSSLAKQLCFASSIGEALVQTNDGESLYIVDDCLISGTQTLNILGDLMGTRKREPHHTFHSEPLTQSERHSLLKRRVAFQYCVVTDTGKDRFLRELPRTGIDPSFVELDFGVIEPYSAKAFEPMGPIAWSSAEERTALKQFSMEVGYSILESRAARKNWSDDRRRESALGYSDFQRLLVFPYNVPKTTLTLLWEGGTESKSWQPLFPGFD